jgi:hypothetical protein
MEASENSAAHPRRVWRSTPPSITTSSHSGLICSFCSVGFDDIVAEGDNWWRMTVWTPPPAREVIPHAENAPAAEVFTPVEVVSRFSEVAPPAAEAVPPPAESVPPAADAVPPAELVPTANVFPPPAKLVPLAAEAVLPVPEFVRRAEVIPPAREVVTLIEPVELSVPYGTLTFPRGMRLRFVTRDGDNVRIHYSNWDAIIPVSATDLNQVDDSPWRESRKTGTNG